MPRGRFKFDTAGSPRDPLWPSEPELAMESIAARHGATYIPRSLVFALNGRRAEALFETVEPEPGRDDATRLHQLGIDLDAFEVTLYIDLERWRIEHPDLCAS